MHSAQGFTLIELMVALAIGAVLATVTTVAFLSDGPEPARDGWARSQARSRSIMSGQVTAFSPDSMPLGEPVLFLPGGMALGADLDLLTGREKR